ncbi:hypothetical protein BV898_14926 [Hypsibius exemplaris]|uniref:Uncharacterized protein n=1 Tax=Hypsibius exemplaris TaxID=2072580 RepID=A0A9X6ND23_HYPEX|nr:hypothetical protein BV898_14926 [Hypsibius exemplaris]
MFDGGRPSLELWCLESIPIWWRIIVSKRVSRVSYASDRSQPHSINYDTEGPLRLPTSSLPVHYEEDGLLRPNRKSRIETFVVAKAKDAPNRRISQARPSRTERPRLEDLKRKFELMSTPSLWKSFSFAFDQTPKRV